MDLSEADYIELDMFVESRQGILDAIADLDSKNGDGGSRWRFLLSSTPSDYNGNNYANVYYVEFFERYITKDGWNHIAIPVSAFEHNGSATLSSIASWGINFYVGTDDTNIAKDQTLAVYNICGTKITAPALHSVIGTTVGILNENNGLITSGWRFGRYYDAGCYQENLTPVDLSEADYIELDMFVESRQGILDAIADLDSKNGDGGARWRFLLSSTPSDYNGSNYANVYYVESFENYIKKDGWNHIVIPVSAFEHNGSATLSSIASWGINFYVGTDDTNIAKDQILAVYNICGTRITAPEKRNTNGTTVNDLNAGNGLITSGWRFGRYYDAGCYQEDLTPVDLSGADYIELDMFVESRQGILDAIADLDSKNGDAGARWRFLLSSTPSDYNGNNYANVYYVEFFENYITKDGWNHIAIPVSEFEHNGSATLSSIASWGINFYVGTGDTNIAKDQKLAVCNICGTKAYTDVAGDVNNDGTTNILDLVRAKKIAANIKTEYNPNAATFNAAGLLAIGRILLGIPG